MFLMFFSGHIKAMAKLALSHNNVTCQKPFDGNWEMGL